MFQSFDQVAQPALAAPRIAALRALMRDRAVDALLVPRADEHQGEYVPACAERLRWLTGFSGSAGLAVVTAKRAALFIDGRYKLQARGEVDTSIFDLPDLGRPRALEWLAPHAPKRGVIGFDPWLHTAAEVERFTAAGKPLGLALRPLSRNLVDAVWGRDRPPRPQAPVETHPIDLAGRSAAEKLADLRAILAEDRQDAVILTLPDSIAWLFNIRGSDVAHNPIVLAFAIVPSKGKAKLFIAPRRIGPEVRSQLRAVAQFVEPSELPARIRELRSQDGRVRVDPHSAASWFFRGLGTRRIVRGADPCLALKARKNEAEIAAARASHVRDGAAITHFLAWLDAKSATGGLDEITAVTKLEECRRATGQLRDISFDTISGSGPNGAIVHYRVSNATNRTLGSGELLLIDSGGQYRDGTTDITRTVAIGDPTPEMRQRFTLVLKGHIAIATARFPKGTRGIDLDAFARRALWDHGLDYDHGTGHGVGSYLSVHEGPQSISRAGMATLEPGMICSNEPGYYQEGAYGIRIENLLLVRPLEQVGGGDREMMSFETLTLAPIDKRLIDASLLSASEIAWLDDYHARVRDILGPEVDPATQQWLKSASRPLR